MLLVMAFSVEQERFRQLEGVNTHTPSHALATLAAGEHLGAHDHYWMCHREFGDVLRIHDAGAQQMKERGHRTVACLCHRTLCNTAFIHQAVLQFRLVR